MKITIQGSLKEIATLKQGFKSGKPSVISGDKNKFNNDAQRLMHCFNEFIFDLIEKADSSQ